MSEKKVNSIEYRKDLWTVRAQLQKMGIRNPVQEMIEMGFWEEDPQNKNYLNGRTINEDFLKELQRFAYAMDTETN